MSSTPTSEGDGERLPSGRATGITIAVASIVSVAFMLYHPSLHAHSMAEFLESIKREELANRVVHGSLVASFAVLVCGFAGLASRLGGFGRAGLVAYGAGAIAFAAAASINGLIVPHYVMRYDGRPIAELDVARHILWFAGSVNQVCSRIGVLAMSVAVVLWSAPLVGRSGARALGILGFIAGGLPAIALLTGYLAMTVHGMLAFLVAQTAWSLAIAVQMIRGRF